MAERTVRVELQGDATGAVRAVLSTRTALEKLVDDVDKTNRRMKDSFKGGFKSAIDVDSKGFLSKLSSAVDAGGQMVSSGMTAAMKAGTSDPRIAMALAAGIVAATPAIATVLSSAIMLGLGGGAIAAGVALAMRDERVKQAGQSFKETFLAQWQTAAEPLIAPVLRGFDRLAVASKSAAMDMRGNFAMLAPIVDQLSAGLVGFIDRVMPGLSAGLQGAMPILSALAVSLPSLGAAIGDFFRIISQGSGDTGAALMGFVGMLGIAIRGAAIMINLLTQAFMAFANVVPGMGPTLLALKAANTAAQEAANGTNAFGAAAESTAQKLGFLTSAALTLQGAIVSTDAAQLKVLEATKAVGEAFEENGAAIDRNSEAGLRNRAALEQAHVASSALRQAKYDETGSVEAANAAYESSIAPALAMAASAGVAEADIAILRNTLLGMPPLTESKVVVHTQLITERITIDSFGTQAYRPPGGGGYIPQRWGGITTHAATGALRDAQMFSGGPTRYAFAEPSTGGEAFVPKRGNYGRSMNILSQAAGWYGAQVVPGGAGAGGSREITLRLVHQTPEGRTIHEELIRYANDTGRSPASLLPVA